MPKDPCMDCTNCGQHDNEPETVLDANGLFALADKVWKLKVDALCADETTIKDDPIATGYFLLAHAALSQAETYFKMASACSRKNGL